MAIIKCIECGNDVSDKAESCPHCGYPVNKTIEESNLDKTVIQTNQLNDDEFKKRKIEQSNLKRKVLENKKYLGILIGIVVCIIIVIVIVMLRGNEDYANANWGESYDNIKTELGEDAIENDGKISKMIDDYDGMSGVSAVVTYNFTNKKLDSIGILLQTSDSEETSDTVYLEYGQKFDDSYGDRTEGSATSYLSTWKTNKSIISMMNFGSGMVTIVYNDVKK